MKALILAAGYSTRLYPLTLNTPKALLPIGGQAMLDYLIDQINTLPDVTDVALVTNARFYADFARWADAAQSRYPRLSFQVIDDGTSSDAQKLGALGDIQFALDRIGMDDDLLIAASDNFFTFPLVDFVDDFKSHGRDTLLGARIESLDDLKRFAVATLSGDRRVTALIEKPAVPPSDVAIYALYLYRRDTLPMLGRYLAEGGSPDAPGHFPEWLCRRRDVRVYLFDGECIDIGTPDAYRDVCARFEGDGHDG